MVERILADFGAAYGLRSAALRYFNACGADPDGEIGEDHDPETHLIPRALMTAAGDRAQGISAVIRARRWRRQATRPLPATISYMGTAGR